MKQTTRKGTFMNVEIAQRLAEMRRGKGYSQEELAENLGLSRQAVSKWERAESSPDTGNLIALAKLYGVTIDDLLRVESDIDDDVKFEAQDKTLSTEAQVRASAEAAQNAAQAAVQAAAAVTAAQAHPVDPPQVAQAAVTGARQAPAQAAATGARQAPAQAAATGARQAPSQPFYTAASSTAYGSVPPPPPYGQSQHPVPPPVVPPEQPGGSAASTRRRGPWSSFPYPVFCVIVVMVAGFFFDAWYPAGLIFLTVPLYYWIAHIIENDPNYRK